MNKKAKNPIEIERKFLIDGFPDLPILEEAIIYQGYLSTDPVVRISTYQPQNDKNWYVLCVKGKGTLARQEIEIDLDRETFCRLIDILPAPMICKIYKTYALPNGLTLECSLVDPEESTVFYYAEVEFDSLKDATNFVPPEFLGREVTEESEYKMAQYWKRKVKNKFKVTSIEEVVNDDKS